MSRASLCGEAWDATKVNTTMVKRRKVLIGIGALTAGSGAAMGTGAFTSQVELAGRDSTMDVVADNNGIVKLDVGLPGENEEDGLGLVTETSDGNIAIDLTLGGGGGINTDAIYEIGTPTAESEDPAFTMTNQMNEQYTFEFKYEFDNPGSINNAVLQIWNSATTTYADNGPDSFNSNAITLNSGNANDTPAKSVTLGPGEAEYFAIRINTEGATPSEDLSGTLTITGTPGSGT